MRKYTKISVFRRLLAAALAAAMLASGSVSSFATVDGSSLAGEMPSASDSFGETLIADGSAASGEASTGGSPSIEITTGSLDTGQEDAINGLPTTEDENGDSNSSASPSDGASYSYSSGDEQPGSK